MILQRRFRSGERIRHGKDARHHPLDIAVDHGGLAVEGNRRDRGRGVWPDSRQCEE